MKAFRKPAEQPLELAGADGEAGRRLPPLVGAQDQADAEHSQRQEPDDSRSCFAHIESVAAKETKIDTH
jgi:hypothetical protein